ncbi:hypothetical protein AOX55_00005020 (plasmid) [Sinorhizobium fredii CCBAU 25509]|nr:hypothetical protein AOX55_00005020 [Sinorhizobium fredii CCBAU 25509]
MRAKRLTAPGRHARAPRQPRQGQVFVSGQALLGQQMIDSIEDFTILRRQRCSLFNV